MELLLVGIYLSVKSLRKPVDYCIFILERLPRYTDNKKGIGHGLGHRPNSDLNN
jgi:hypothetical protein